MQRPCLRQAQGKSVKIPCMIKARQIIYMDMDAFYASVEQLDKAKLAGKPVIVGGPRLCRESLAPAQARAKSRAVVIAASYEARRFGVGFPPSGVPHSAMPMAKAVRLCPHAVVLPARMERYIEVSEKVQAIFERYTPLVEAVSLDEAFLDVTDSTALFGTAEEIGLAIKKTIKEQLGLTASVGIASNKFLAKLASDLEKPDGFVVITEQKKQEILDPLPVGKIWGVGKVTEQALRSHGIKTIAELRKTPLQKLRAIVGNYAATLLELASGIDEREVEPARQAKSLSSEQTFATDIEDAEILLAVLLHQVEEVAQRLRAAKLKARTVELKLRYADFRTITRCRTLNEATNTTQTLWQTAKAIFQEWRTKSPRKRGPDPLRLVGFAASGLVKQDTEQQQLFVDADDQKQERVDKAVDRIKNRYGDDAMRRGT